MKTVSEILAKYRLCFDCAGGNHKAAECPTKKSGSCDRRHHPSICDRTVREEKDPGDDGKSKKLYTIK